MQGIDRYVHDNSAEWARLEELVDLAQNRRSRLSTAELDELLARYQHTSTHLAHIRSAYGDPQLTARLTRAVSGARA
ncbi:MAG: stage II sporulation protein M, partial [Acidimicrobiales bacterium]